MGNDGWCGGLRCAAADLAGLEMVRSGVGGTGEAAASRMAKQRWTPEEEAAGPHPNPARRRGPAVSTAWMRVAAAGRERR